MITISGLLFLVLGTVALSLSPSPSPPPSSWLIGRYLFGFVVLYMVVISTVALLSWPIFVWWDDRVYAAGTWLCTTKCFPIFLLRHTFWAVYYLAYAAVVFIVAQAAVQGAFFTT